MAVRPFAWEHIVPSHLITALVVIVVFAGLWYAFTGHPLRGKTRGAMETITLANGLVFLLEGFPLHAQLRVVPPLYEPVVREAGLVPAAFVTGQQWWAPVTQMFVHADLPHVFFNMLILWLVAPRVEDGLGRRWFVALYLLTGLAATVVALAALLYIPPETADSSLFHLPSWNAANIGASGAVFGIVGVAIGAFPREKIPVFAGFIPLPLGPVTAAIVLIGVEIFRALLSPGIAWWAHVAGLFVGILAGILWRLAHPPPPEPVAPLDGAESNDGATSGRGEAPTAGDPTRDWGF